MDYERILLVKQECHVYKLPPRPSTNRAYRAADWVLDKPSWTGRLRITTKGKSVAIKMEDKITGELFAEAPVDEYPSVAVESVSDSSRYFVIRIKDPSGRTAFIGIGFADRGDAFDFNVSLQDHFNAERKDTLIQEQMTNKPALDLKLKEGQTISINLGGKMKKTGNQGTSRPKPQGAGSGLLLPPPPGGSRSISAPPKAVTVQPQQSSLLDFSGGASSQNSDWTDFSAAEPPKPASGDENPWVQF